MLNRRRQCRGLSRGLSLFGSLLALGLLGAMVLAAATFFETRLMEERSRLAGRQLMLLADASASHAQGRFTDLLGAVRNGPVEIPLADLRADGSLPAGFPEVDALGRGHRVLILAAGADGFDLLAAQTVPAGDTVVPSAALFEASGRTRMGLVAPDEATRLAGPVIDADVSAFQAAFAGAPEARALAALARFDRQTVFGDQLYRIAVPGFPALNRMETGLDLGGNRIANAGALEADSLTLDGDLSVGGALAVTSDLVVGRAVRIAGAAEIAGNAAAATARIAGAASAGRLTVRNALRAASLTATGAVRAGSIGAAGAVAAGSARLTSLQSDRVTARAVTATRVAASSAAARQVRATERIDAARAGFGRLTVGSCSGC